MKENRRHNVPIPDSGIIPAADSFDGAPVPNGAAAEAEWQEIRRIISRYYGEWTDTSYPGAVNNRIPNTALLGNGDVGISSDGDDTRKSFSISKGDFWEYNNSPLKAGTISIVSHAPSDDNPFPFYEKMNILDAKIVTRQQLSGVPLQIESWMSAVNNLFVMEITSLSETTDAEIHVNLKGFENGGRPTDARTGNGCMTVTRSTLTDFRTDLEPIYETTPYISKVAMATRVIGAEGTYEAESSSSANLITVLPAGKTVYVVTAVCGGGRTYTAAGKLWEGRTEPAAEAEALLGTIGTEADVKTLREAHRNWWKHYWMQSYISLDTSDPDLADVQKYYYAAQYELGAGIRCGKTAAGLYGIWHSTDTPSWHSDFHLNYNFIAAYYGLAASNRVSMLLPAVEAIMDYVPQGIKNAGSIQQLRVIDSRNLHIDKLIELGKVDPEKGIENAVLYPVAIAPYGMTVENNSYHGETLNAPFSVHPLAEYYSFTQDKKFMKNTLYVYIRYVLNFLEHWLVREDGRYIHYAAYNEGSWAKNASLELMAYKMCLKYGIRIAQELGDDDCAAKWQEIYDNLAPQPLLENYNGTGKTILGLAETYLPRGGTDWIIPADVPGLSGGNTLPLEAVVPFEVFGYYSSDGELEIIRNTVDAYNGSWAQINSFPKIYVQAVNTRYDCRTILRNLADTIRKQMKKNLMIEDNVHGIEKAGATEAVNNMLLLSDKGIIKLFGNWLEDKDASFTRLRAAGAFVFSAEYDGSAREIAEGAVMYSEAGATAAVASLWKNGMTVLDEDGNPVKTVKGTAPNHDEEIIYTFATEKGMTYTFRKESFCG